MLFFGVVFCSFFGRFGEPCWGIFGGQIRSKCVLFLVLCLCCFFVRFWVVLGCHFGAFLEPTSDQNPYMSFLIFIDFSLFFAIIFSFGRVLCSSYVGSFFGSFFASIFGRFLGRFWGHFGRLLGVNIGHFGHRFWMNFACRSKSGQERPRSTAKAANSAPGAARSSRNR